MNKYLLLLLLSVLGSLKGTSQTLFLPPSLSTSNLEHLQDFAEGPNESYFFAGRTNTGSIDFGISVINGTVYKTNKTGTLLKQFTLPGELRNYYISFEGIHIQDNNVFVVATKFKMVRGEY